MKVGETITDKFKNSHIPVDWLENPLNPYVDVTEKKYYAIFKEIEKTLDTGAEKEESVEKTPGVKYVKKTTRKTKFNKNVEIVLES